MKGFNVAFIFIFKFTIKANGDVQIYIMSSNGILLIIVQFHFSSHF